MSSQPETIWFITGTSRGIGLEMTKQLLQSPTNTVLATCRAPTKADALQALSASASGRLHILQLDVNDIQSIKDAARDAAQIVGEKGIDYLVNNAGIFPGGLDTAFAFEPDDLTATLKTNVVGPASVALSFLPLLERRGEGGKKTIINISSKAGSIGGDFGTICATYAVSKAALNMLTYKQAKGRPDLTVVSICPGYLQTDMGGPYAELPVSVGVEGVLKVVASLTHADSGAFFNHEGARLQW